jgi:hypothetical protein
LDWLLLFAGANVLPLRHEFGGIRFHEAADFK